MVYESHTGDVVTVVSSTVVTENFFLPPYSVLENEWMKYTWSAIGGLDLMLSHVIVGLDVLLSFGGLMALVICCQL